MSELGSAGWNEVQCANVPSAGGEPARISLQGTFISI